MNKRSHSSFSHKRDLALRGHNHDLDAFRLRERTTIPN